MQYGIKKFILLLLFFSTLAPVAMAQGGEAELAGKYYEEGEFENALQLYQKLQKKEPSDQFFNLRIVSCHQKLERYEEAIDFLDKVMRRLPEDHLYGFVQADLYKLTGEFKKSESLETETIEKKITAESEFMGIGAWLYQGGKYKLALRTYLQVVLG
jgi:tetratricopeptide (TPR) repeat protein